MIGPDYAVFVAAPPIPLAVEAACARKKRQLTCVCVFLKEVVCLRPSPAGMVATSVYTAFKVMRGIR
jgi:hypothetical protein